MLVCRKSREGGEVKHKNIKFSGKHRRRCETQEIKREVNARVCLFARAAACCHHLPSSVHAWLLSDKQHSSLHPPWNTSTGVRKRQQPLPWPLLHTLFVSLYLTIKKMAYFIYSTGKIAFCLNSSSSKIISVIWGHVAVKIYKNACPRWVASWNRKCVEKISRAKAWNSLPVVPLEQDQVVWQISIWLLSKISRLHLAVKDYQLRQELFTLLCAKWFQQQQ